MKYFLNAVLLLVAIVILVPTVIVRGCTKKPAKQNPNCSDNLSPLQIECTAEQPFVTLYDHINKKLVKLLLEEYVVGTVAAEMPASFQYEALKAQAVASRTLVVKKMKAYGGQGCSKYPGADVCSRFDHCQAWLSDEQLKKNWGEKYEENFSRIKKAVEETRGQIMVYEGKPIEVFFFSTSNGRTEDAKEVFARSFPYYKVVESKGEEDAPKYREIFTFSNKKFVDIFKTSYPESNLSVDRLSCQVRITDYTESGRVRELIVGGVKIKGTDFRKIYGLNSTDFNFKFYKDRVEICTTGYGHGVGMSQVGADRMAQNGYTYEEILKHYYPGVDIKKLYK